MSNLQTGQNIYNNNITYISLLILKAISLSSLNFHDLYEKREETELNSLFQSNGVFINENELKILFSAFQNLKLFYSNVEKGISSNQPPPVPPLSNNSENKLQQQQIPSTPTSTSTSSVSQSSNSSSSSSSIFLNQQQQQTPPPPLSSTPADQSNPAAAVHQQQPQSQLPPPAHHNHHHHHHHTPTTNANANPPPVMVLPRAKQQRKSESDVQIDAVQIGIASSGGANNKANTAGVLLNESQLGLLSKNYFLSSNIQQQQLQQQQQQQQASNSQQHVKNFPFTSNQPVKSNKSMLTYIILYVQHCYCYRILLKLT